MQEIENFSIVEADALDYPSHVLCHITNCQNCFGAGIAKQIRERYREAYVADLQTDKGARYKLGGYTYARTRNKKGEGPLYIFNLYGQFKMHPYIRQLDYEAFYKGLECLKDFCFREKVSLVSFPYLVGCGRAGGNWRIVSTIIEEVTKNTGMKVVYCKK